MFLGLFALCYIDVADRQTQQTEIYQPTKAEGDAWTQGLNACYAKSAYNPPDDKQLQRQWRAGWYDAGCCEDKYAHEAFISLERIGSLKEKVRNDPRFPTLDLAGQDAVMRILNGRQRCSGRSSTR